MQWHLGAVRVWAGICSSMQRVALLVRSLLVTVIG
jgi:hypothetical protein